MNVRSVLAPFPEGVLPVEGAHFGANLITYILDQYHHAQVTEPLLLEQLGEYGIDISAGPLEYISTDLAREEEPVGRSCAAERQQRELLEVDGLARHQRHERSVHL